MFVAHQQLRRDLKGYTRPVETSITSAWFHRLKLTCDKTASNCCLQIEHAALAHGADGRQVCQFTSWEHPVSHRRMLPLLCDYLLPAPPLSCLRLVGGLLATSVRLCMLNR